ncbi:MAG TPA: hypothetical protein PK926_07785 [Spirochaetota bacterium]|nr:hypothetical protein [Spirochaetota bacterium]HPI90291.1 hypothetical protein [Spirochaetota bacterium]HPR46371.1 hypothetical protein [Spirochaetota bacterium]
MKTRVWIFVFFLVYCIAGCDDDSGKKSSSRAWTGPDYAETYNSSNAYYPKIAMDGQGNAIAVWNCRDISTNTYRIWANRYDPATGWAQPEPIESDASGSLLGMSVAMNSDGCAIVVWHKGDGLYDSIWANRYDPEYGWGQEELVEQNAYNALNPCVAIDSQGNAIAVWQQYDSTRFNIWANRYEAGYGWGEAALIESDNTDDATLPRVAVDPDGNAVAVWLQNDATRDNVLSNRYTAGTGWGTPEPLESGTYTAFAPRVAIDSQGRAIALWRQYDGTGFSIWHSLYAPGTGWSGASVIESDVSGSAEEPDLAMDTNGNAMAVWQLHDGSRSAIWGSRYTAGFGWGQEELVELDHTGDAERPHVSVNARGSAVAVWHQYDGSNYNAWANLYSTRSGWGTASLLETDDAGYADYPYAAIDPWGNAVAVWQQDDGYIYNIMTNRYR